MERLTDTGQTNSQKQDRQTEMETHRQTARQTESYRQVEKQPDILERQIDRHISLFFNHN